MVINNFGQATLTKIILNRFASAVNTVTDFLLRNRIKLITKLSAALIVNIIISFIKKKLAEEFVIAIKAFLIIRY